MNNDHKPNPFGQKRLRRKPLGEWLAEKEKNTDG